MMKKLTARATLIYMIKMLTECLEELKSTAKDGFTYGEKRHMPSVWKSYNYGRNRKATDWITK